MRPRRFPMGLAAMGALAALAVAVAAPAAHAGTRVLTAPPLERVEGAGWHPGPRHDGRHDFRGDGHRGRWHDGWGARHHGWSRRAPHWHAHPPVPRHPHGYWAPRWGPGGWWFWDGWGWRPR